MSTQRFSKAVPTFFMGKSAADSRICEFMSTKHPALSTALAKTETKSIWYSFEHIENLYKELVYLNADGLRIYFGAYEENHPDFSGQLCLVMVPTRLDELNIGHEDVILEDDVDFSERPGSEMFNDEEDAKAFNYGAPCPTMCPTVQGQLKYPLTAGSCS